MSRAHNNYDVFINDTLVAKATIIYEDAARKVVTVKERKETNRWERVLMLTDTGPLLRQRGTDDLRWEGTDADGQQVTLTAIRIAGKGCIPCSQRRK